MLSPRDSMHAQALSLSQSKKRRILTTEFVIVELANLFSQVPDRRTFIEFVRYMRAHRHTTITPASSQLIERGFALFSARPDKEWSLTDCISFVVMEEHGITDALTADGDFEQAGFNALLLP
jgi:predicted nucleic acid-binding protein